MSTTLKNTEHSTRLQLNRRTELNIAQVSNGGSSGTSNTHLYIPPPEEQNSRNSSQDYVEYRKSLHYGKGREITLKTSPKSEPSSDEEGPQRQSSGSINSASEGFAVKKKP
jgi:hypothetical protein